jgi:hypothetical protein
MCFYYKRFNHRQDECRTQIQDNQPCTDSRGRKYWPKRYTDEETTKRNDFPHFNVDELCPAIEGQPSSAATTDTQPVLGLINDLQQII